MLNMRNGIINDIKNHKLIEQIRSSKSGYILVHEDDQTNEIAHFYFLGNYEGNPTVYDTFLYTLRMHHSSEISEIVETKAVKRFPDFVKLNAENELNNPKLNESEEEIGLFMAATFLEIEEEETVRVKEHIDIDSSNETDVYLDVGLNIDEVTDVVIVKFIQEFNGKSIKLDETVYSYQHGER